MCLKSDSAAPTIVVRCEPTPWPPLTWIEIWGETQCGLESLYRLREAEGAYSPMRNWRSTCLACAMRTMAQNNRNDIRWLEKFRETDAHERSVVRLTSTMQRTEMTRWRTSSEKANTQWLVSQHYQPNQKISRDIFKTILFSILNLR